MSEQDALDEKAVKRDHSLLPGIFLDATTDALSNGAAKYSRRGYLHEPGYDISAWRALLRHVVAIQSGENYDLESGQHHLNHIAANVAMILDVTAEHGWSRDWPEPDEVKKDV
jgi:hypothetical protein